METKKVLGIIFSVLFIGAFAFVLSWGIINFNKVKDGMSGTGVYTQEDVNNAYEDGYNTALEDKDEYDALIDSYRDTITSQTDQISQLNSQITILNNNNKDYKNQVSNLESQKTSLQVQVVNLTTIKSNNEITISQLNTQIAELEKEVTDLKNSGEDKDETIAQKNTQIINLQSTVSQLQKTNELNVETITNLNNQIASLNTQITDMTLQIQNNSTNVTALNNKIAELEKSVAYYEQYIANLENGEQVVATFEFNGSVYNIQIVNKNSTVSVVNPTSTDYVIFNYWTVNGEQIDLSTYQITSNVKIVANVTYKYDVKFMVDDTEYNSQIVIKNGYATIPANPTKTGYEFDGWTTNGVDIVNPNTTSITQNITYTAKFTKLHTVTFMYEDITYTTQIVRNNEYSANVTVNNTDYKVFNGWKLNGVIVDVTSQKIVADTTFIADVTYKYDVKFMVDETEYNNQIVALNGYATTPTNPTKTGYEFDGWTINGVDIVNPNTTAITQNTTYTAKFTKLHTVKFLVDNSVFATQTIRNNNKTTMSSIPSKSGFDFVGWSLNNTDTVNVSDITITSDTTFYAIFKECSGLFVDGVMTKTWEQCVSDGIVTVSGASITGADLNTSGELRIPTSINSIGDNAFYISKFTKIVLPSSISSIGKYAFAYMYYLTEINLPSNISVIPSGLFEKDKLLQNIVLHEGITKISEYAFDGCHAFTEISFPSSLITIDKYAFYGCSNVSKVNFASNSQLTTIGVSAFAYCSALTTITIPNVVNSMGNECFMSCTNLVSVYLSDNVLTIGTSFFEDCTSLTTVKLPTKLNKIGVYAFYGCTSLKTLYIPASVTTISCSYDDGDLDAMPFEDCKNLVLYCGVSSAPSGYNSGWNAWGYSSGQTVSVKYGYTYEQYLTAIGA